MNEYLTFEQRWEQVFQDPEFLAEVKRGTIQLERLLARWIYRSPVYGFVSEEARDEIDI